MLKKLRCWLAGHDWVYTCSFIGWPTGWFPFGGMRVHCRRCQKMIQVKYLEKMEITMEKEMGNG